MSVMTIFEKVKNIIFFKERIAMKKQVIDKVFLGLVLLVFGRVYAVEPNTVVATINTGVNPAGLALSRDNNVAYVANNNNYGIAGADSVSVLNLAQNTLKQMITDASFNEPYTITMSIDGTKAYVTNSNSSTITIINTITNAVAGIISGFDGPSGMVIMPAGDKAYVNNYGGPGGLGSGNGKTLRVVDLNTNTIVGSPITVDLAPAALAISSDGAFVYSVNYVDGNPGTGTINVIDTNTNIVVDIITGFSGPFAIALTPDGSYAYVTNFGSNNFAPFGTTVSVVNLESNMIVDTIELAIQPSGIGITPDGHFAYATNYNTLYAGSNFSDLTAGQGTVTIIDIATNTVISPTIAVGQSPANIAISSKGEFAYVSNYTSNTVSVIALQSFHLSNVKGCKLKKHCVDGKNQHVNKLSWKAKGTSLPVSYALFRDAQLTDLVATFPATSRSMKYFDHVQHKQDEYVYYLVGTNAVGTTSAPVEIVVQRKCKHCK
jgi:YVTN family beta-propeller protein